MYDMTTSVLLELFKNTGDGLDSNASPSKLFLEKNRVADSDAIIGTNINKNPIPFAV